MNQESCRNKYFIYLKLILSFWTTCKMNLLKFILNMWLFNIIDINWKIFILIIEINNASKFSVQNLVYGYFTFFLTRIMKCILDCAFTPNYYNNKTFTIVVQIVQGCGNGTNFFIPLFIGCNTRQLSNEMSKHPKIVTPDMQTYMKNQGFGNPLKFKNPSCLCYCCYTSYKD
jgi:hypothetical protein